METRQVTLTPGEFREVAFAYTPQQARTYHVTVNGLSGSFEAIGVEEYHTIPLVAGWNNNVLYDGHTGNIAILTSNIIGLEMIYLYEAETWFWYNPTWPTEANTLPALENGKAYQIKVTTAQDWEVPNP